MEWKPKRWLATLLSLVLGPLGLMYVQRPRWAAGYFAVGLVIQVASVVLLLSGGMSQDAALGIGVLGWALNIIAAVHAFRIASVSTATTRHWYSRWYGLLAFPVVAVVSIALFRAFLYEPYRFPSEAMYPNVREGALVVARKFGYGNYGTYGVTFLRTSPSVTLERGQLIFFHTTDDDRTVFFKRVIGLPGDHVLCRGRRLVINGEAVPTTPAGADEKYEYVDELLGGEIVRIAHLKRIRAKGCDEVVPPGHYFVLGDNRSNSRDSRYFGTVPRANLVGGAAATFYPDPRSGGD